MNASTESDDFDFAEDPALFAELGRVSAYMSLLEWSMVMSVSRILGKTHTEAACLVGGDDFSILIKKLSKLVSKCCDKEIKDYFFEHISPKLDSIRESRNQFIHATYYSQNGKLFRWKYQKGLNAAFDTHKSEEMEIDTLKALSIEIRVIANLLIKMFRIPTGAEQGSS